MKHVHLLSSRLPVTSRTRLVQSYYGRFIVVLAFILPVKRYLRLKEAHPAIRLHMEQAPNQR
jgi:hypothetical protein